MIRRTDNDTQSTHYSNLEKKKLTERWKNIFRESVDVLTETSHNKFDDTKERFEQRPKKYRYDIK